jgi:ABC-type lipoprotein export system ATPase subunit
MIKVIGLEKVFFIDSKTVKVLKNISFEIKSGEKVSICGPSGAGKSTLLHILGLMDTFSSGSIELFNSKIENMDENLKTEFRNKYIGFLFQFHYLIPDFTVLENLMIPLWIKKENKNNIKEKIKTLTTALGIESLLDRYPNELSGGEQQRVALARSLVNEPKLILADEPTGNLDSKNSGLVVELLFNEVRKRNVTLIIATHSIELANMTDRIIYLQDGMIKN